MVDISKYTLEAKTELLDRICTMILTYLDNEYITEDVIDTLLFPLVEALDEADQGDSFGTEGWEKNL